MKCGVGIAVLEREFVLVRIYTGIPFLIVLLVNVQRLLEMIAQEVRAFKQSKQASLQPNGGAKGLGRKESLSARDREALEKSKQAAAAAAQAKQAQESRASRGTSSNTRKQSDEPSIAATAAASRPGAMGGATPMEVDEDLERELSGQQNR
ncbi:hypothetical protein BC936DRAFT_144306 [Jimgerdemannia flammicorona]|uniref:Uncharacterized protein n=1 Tax=Jimgerdemannia flammicorona TaxID=994334 RepID=A0A432ZXZ6_9FUNG|nr:hypothetical protein BC936DRAFT_144306 [Jimgerdemannia flammicorona]